MAVGAASPTAQGQAMTMTASANMKEKRAGPSRIEDRGSTTARQPAATMVVDVDVAIDFEASVAT